MDLHLVLFELWQAQFGRDKELNAQLMAHAREVGGGTVVRQAYGKSTLRPWTGPDLFRKP